MKKPYLIIYNPFDTPEEEIAFSEVISSNFISKKIRKNAYAIVNDKGLKPKEIFDLIHEKSDLDSNILIIKYDKFYGTFHSEGINWIKEKFPDLDWIN